MTSFKIPGHLQLHQVIRCHHGSTPCMTMMCLLPIQFPPPATSSLFKVLLVEVLHIAWYIQAGLRGLIRKRLHLFQPWKTLVCSMQLLLAYKKMPPIRRLHPNHGDCSRHQLMCLEHQHVSRLPCIQLLLVQILLHMFQPSILWKVMMKFLSVSCGPSIGIVPCWHQEQPCRRAMSLLKCPIILLFNKVAPPVTCNQWMKHLCKGYIHASIASGSSYRSILCLHEIEV